MGAGARVETMTHADKMDLPTTVTLPAADWWVIQGLLTAERNTVRDEAGPGKPPWRPEYLKTLERMRETIRRSEQ